MVRDFEKKGEGVRDVGCLRFARDCDNYLEHS